MCSKNISLSFLDYLFPTFKFCFGILFKNIISNELFDRELVSIFYVDVPNFIQFSAKSKQVRVSLNVG